MPDLSSPVPLRDDAPEAVRFGPFVLDVRERRLTRAGEAVALSSRYLDLLAALVARPGRLVDKQALFDAVWPGVVVGDAALSQGIRAVRVALGDDAAAPTYVETVAGHGYRFIAPVEPADGHAPNAADAANARRDVLYGVSPTPGDGPNVGTAANAHDAPAPSRTSPIDASYRLGLLAPEFSLRPRSDLLSRTGAVLGALVAALVGGALYGYGIGAGGPHLLRTLASVTVLSLAVGGLGAAAVASAARLAERRGVLVALLAAGVGGGVAGLVGAFVGASLLSTLAGREVGLLTGPAEGFLIGLAVVAGPLLVKDRALAVATSAALTLVVFAGLAASGRPTFIGSLEQTLALADSPLRLSLLAPGGLTPGLRVLLSAFEGALFGLGFGAGAVVRRYSR